MIPVALGGCAGWLHPAPGRRGVILVPPWGFEALCVHRSLRRLADALAARGLPCLRLDPPGCGDSLDPPPGTPLVEAWIEAITGAAGWLHDHGRVGELALVGLRLGALLAAEAAARLGGVERLALLAPPASGRACVRELRAWARLAEGGPDDHGSAVLAEGGLVAGGFILGAPALAALAGLDPLARCQPPARHLLLLERPEMRLPAGFLAGWRRAGATIRVETMHFYAELVRDPLLSEPPADGFAGLADWLADAAPVVAEPARPEPAPSDPATCPTARLAGSGFVEELRTFGSGGRLAGVLTRPAGAGRHAGDRPALLILNTGATHRVGPGRVGVELARAAADHGIAALRMDLGGIGDSDSAADARRPDIYRRSALEDVRAGLALLAEAGFWQVVAVGVCSGAFMAFHAARTEPQLVGLVLVNLPRFGWRPFHPLVFARTRAILAMLRHAAIWRQALRGRGDLAPAVRVLGERLAARLALRLPRPVRRLAAGISRPRRWLARLARRGVRTLVLYAAHDPGLPLFDRVMGARRGRLAEGALEVEVVAEANHAFSDPVSRAILVARTLAHLDRHWPATGSVVTAAARTAGRPPASSDPSPGIPAVEPSRAMALEG